VDTRNDGAGPSHHLYFARDVSDVVVEDTTFRNGDSWSIQIYPGPNLTNMAFNRVVFENVRAGVVIQSASNITFDGVTATSNRYEPGYSWFKVNSGSNILVKNAEVWDAPIGTGFTTENVVVH
jgi:polygalacturonase